MYFEEECTYHVYNRSNQQIFLDNGNYLFFLHKIRKYITPYADILAWCLIPNHFHLMICPKAEGVLKVKEKHLPNTQVLSKQFGTCLSSYTKAFNSQKNRRGSLFAHKTKAKLLNDANNSEGRKLYLNYAQICFRYIHFNPVKHKLVNDISLWEYSSYKDFSGERNGNLINKALAEEIVEFDLESFRAWSLMAINDDEVNNIL